MHGTDLRYRNRSMRFTPSHPSKSLAFTEDLFRPAPKYMSTTRVPFSSIFPGCKCEHFARYLLGGLGPVVKVVEGTIQAPRALLQARFPEHIRTGDDTKQMPSRVSSEHTRSFGTFSGSLRYSLFCPVLSGAGWWRWSALSLGAGIPIDARMQPIKPQWYLPLGMVILARAQQGKACERLHY